MTRAQSLRGLCGGAVYLPGGPGFDEARTPWNVAVEQRPAAIAYPANATETSQVVRAAVAAGLRVAPQSTVTTRACWGGWMTSSSSARRR